MLDALGLSAIMEFICKKTQIKISKIIYFMDHYFVSPYIPFKMLTFVVLLINIVNNANEEIIISHINLYVAFWQFQVMSHLFAIAPVDRQSAAICKQIGSSVTSYLREVTPDTCSVKHTIWGYMGISASDFTK